MAAIAIRAHAMPPSPPPHPAPPPRPARTNPGSRRRASRITSSKASSSTYPSRRRPSKASAAGPDTESHGSPRATNAHSSSVLVAPRRVSAHVRITAVAAAEAPRRTDGLRCAHRGVNAAASTLSTLGAVSLSHRAVRFVLSRAAASVASAPVGGGPRTSSSFSSSSSPASSPPVPSEAVRPDIILRNLSRTSPPSSPRRLMMFTLTPSSSTHVTIAVRASIAASVEDESSAADAGPLPSPDLDPLDAWRAFARPDTIPGRKKDHTSGSAVFITRSRSVRRDAERATLLPLAPAAASRCAVCTRSDTAYPTAGRFLSAVSATACSVSGRTSRSTSLAHVTAASRRSSRSDDRDGSSEGSDPARASTATTSQKRSAMKSGLPHPGSNRRITVEIHLSDSSRVLILRAWAFGFVAVSPFGSVSLRITAVTGKRMKSRERSIIGASMDAIEAATAAR